MLRYLIFCLLIYQGIFGSPLDQRIEELINRVDPTALLGIEVVSLKDGKVLYSQNGAKRFVPASSLKVFLAAAALEILGPEYRFKTELLRDGQMIEGVLIGNCYVRAAGDPSLSRNDLEKLVLSMKNQGVHAIQGDLVLDLSVFDHVELGPGWMWDEPLGKSCSPVGALNISHNRTVFTIKPARQVGAACSVFCGSGIRIINESKTVRKGQNIQIERKEDGTFRVFGSMGVNEAAINLPMPLQAPHFYAAEILKDFFSKSGVAFKGRIRLGKCPAHGKVISHVSSKPLTHLLEKVLKYSDNLYADAIFKKIGECRFGKPGSWEKGQKGVTQFLSERVGLDMEDLILVDGCGLSRYNLVSPKQMVHFLYWAHTQFEKGNLFKEGLCISGQKGFLAKRMKQVNGEIRGKTGVMTGVSSLCGYINNELAFVIFVNGFVKSGSYIKKELEDPLCHVLLDYAR